MVQWNFVRDVQEKHVFIELIEPQYESPRGKHLSNAVCGTKLDTVRIPNPNPSRLVQCTHWNCIPSWPAKIKDLTSTRGTLRR